MSRHVPVLLAEVITGLNLKEGNRVIDCTLGDGGHSEKILEMIGPQGKLLGIDADPESLMRAKQYLYNYSDQSIFVRDNFVNLTEIVRDNNFGLVDGILADFGWSSPQFEERGRGFSFTKDEPLDMRYAKIKNQNSKIKDNELTAAEILNELSQEELEKIFKNYGEEKLAKEIAAAIVSKRAVAPIERTSQLAEIVLQVYREKLHTDKEIPWIGGIHPATQVFQALRIAVNRELEVIKQFLPQAVAALKPGGRLAVITFHSLEDRIAKQYFKTQENRTIKLVNKKPLSASEEELASNPRAHSAKLRVVEKI